MYVSSPYTCNILYFTWQVDKLQLENQISLEWIQHLPNPNTETRCVDAGIILCKGPANERQHYIVTSSLLAGRIHKMIHVVVINRPLRRYGSNLLYPSLKGGVYWFHLVCPSICGQNGVRSVSSTILIWSTSYLHILSRIFRRCVTSKFCFKIKKNEILANSLNL